MTRGYSTLRRDDRRGVSEVLAFTLVFGIVITSVFLLYSVGFSSLTELRDGQQQLNSQRAFELLGGSIDEIEEEGAPKRSSSLQLAGGSLAVNDGPRVRVTINGSETVLDRRAGSLQYGVDETTYGYEAGARFLQTEDGGLSTHSAPFRCDAESGTAVINVVVLRSDDGGLSGEGTVTVTGTKRVRELRTVRNAPGAVDNVSVTIDDSQFQSQWEDSFEDSDWTNPTGDTYVCDADAVYVWVTVVDIEFQ